MAREKKPKAGPPPPPTDEPTEKATPAPPVDGAEPPDDGERDDAADGDGEGAQDDPGKGLFEDDIPPARVEERVQMPSPAVGAQAGPRLPDLGGQTFDNRIPPPWATPGSQPAPPPFAQAQEPGQPYEPDNPDAPPDQPRRDGDPVREAEAATAGRETDQLVNAFVYYEDEEHGGQMVSCGLLHRITMTRAVMPETYIPAWVGGNTFWIHLYFLGSGTQIGRPVSSPFPHRANTGRPFARGWRVDMDLDQIIREKLAAAGVVVPPGVPGQASGTIPINYAQGQVGYFQQQMDAMQKRLDLADERARRAEEDVRMRSVVDPLKETVNELKNEVKLLRDNGGGKSGHSDDLVKLVASVLESRDKRDERDEDRAIRIHELKYGPTAVSTQFNIMSAMSELQMKMLDKVGKGAGINVSDIVDKIPKLMESQAKQRQDDMKFKADLEEKREDRADKRAERAAAKKEQGGRVNRNIDAMIEGIVSAVKGREPPDRVAKLVTIFCASAIEFKWAEWDNMITAFVHDLSTNPEKPVSEFLAPKAGITQPTNDDVIYLLGIAANIRRHFGLPAFDPRAAQQPPTPPAPEKRPDSPPQEAPAASTSAPAPVAADPPAAGAGQAQPASAAQADAVSPPADPAPVPEEKP